MLEAGSSVTCRYELVSPDGGRLSLPQHFFTAHGETVHGAILELADGSERRINVTMGPRVGEASFILAD